MTLDRNRLRFVVSASWTDDVAAVDADASRAPQVAALREALSAPIDLCIDGVALTPELPPERLFPFVRRALHAVRDVVLDGTPRAVVTRESAPWELSLRRDPDGGVLVSVYSFADAGHVTARSVPLAPTALLDAASRLLDELGRELDEVKGGALHDEMRAELARLRADIEGRPVAAAGVEGALIVRAEPLAVETRSNDGLVIATRIDLDDGELARWQPDAADDALPLLATGTISLLPDAAAGIRLEGHPIAALDAFVTSLETRLSRADRAAPRPLRLRVGDDAVRVDPPRTLAGEGVAQGWTLDWDARAFVLLVLEHIDVVVARIRDVNPALTQSLRLTGLEEAAADLRARLGALLRGVEAATETIESPSETPAAASRARAPGVRAPSGPDLRYVRMRWAWSRVFATRALVDAWPMGNVWIVRTADMIAALDARTGRSRWSLELPDVPATARPIVSGEVLAAAVDSGTVAVLDPRTGATARLVDLGGRKVVSLAALPGEPGGFTVVAGEALLVVDAGGAVRTYEGAGARARAARAAGLDIVADRHGMVTAYGPRGRPRWARPGPEARVELAVGPGWVAAWTPGLAELPASVLVLNAATGAIRGRATLKGQVAAAGVPADGLPVWVTGSRRPERIVQCTVDGGLVSAPVADSQLPEGNLACLVGASHVIVAGPDRTVALETRRATRVWEVSAPTDRRTMRALERRVAAGPLVLPAADRLTWVAEDSGRAVAELEAVWETPHAILVGDEGAVLVVDVEGDRTTLRAVLPTGRLEVLPSAT